MTVYLFTKPKPCRLTIKKLDSPRLIFYKTCEYLLPFQTDSAVKKPRMREKQAQPAELLKFRTFRCVWDPGMICVIETSVNMKMQTKLELQVIITYQC